MHPIEKTSWAEAMALLWKHHDKLMSVRLERRADDDGKPDRFWHVSIKTLPIDRQVYGVSGASPFLWEAFFSAMRRMARHLERVAPAAAAGCRFCNRPDCDHTDH